jgi:hypothetical protein
MRKIKEFTLQKAMFFKIILVTYNEINKLEEVYHD